MAWPEAAYHQLSDLLDEVQEPSLASKLVWVKRDMPVAPCKTATIRCRRRESNVGPGRSSAELARITESALDSEIRNVAAASPSLATRGRTVTALPCSRKRLATGASVW